MTFIAPNLCRMRCGSQEWQQRNAAWQCSRKRKRQQGCWRYGMQGAVLPSNYYTRGVTACQERKLKIARERLRTVTIYLRGSVYVLLLLRNKEARRSGLLVAGKRGTETRERAGTPLDPSFPEESALCRQSSCRHRPCPPGSADARRAYRAGYP